MKRRDSEGPERFVIVCFAENDASGHDRGLIAAAHFTDWNDGRLSYDTPPLLELESPFIDDDGEPDGPASELRRTDDPRSLMEYVISGERFRVHDMRSWVGNVCWDGYVMRLSDAQRVARLLVDGHGFHVDAETERQPFLDTTHIVPALAIQGRNDSTETP